MTTVRESLVELDRYKQSRREARTAEEELVAKIGELVGAAVDIKGFTSTATYTTAVRDKQSGELGLVSAPTYSIVRGFRGEQNEPREPTELEGVALLGVGDGGLSVSVVSPGEVEARADQPSAAQSYCFPLNNLTYIRPAVQT